MHCPNCGAEASKDQNFCRVCGFGFGKVTRLIAEQSPDEKIDLAQDPNEARSNGWRHFLFTFFIIAFLTHNVFAVITGNTDIFWTVGFIIFLLGILAAGAHLEFGRKRLNKQESRQPAYSINAPTTKKLMPQSGLEMNASVTERTTARLAEKIES